MHPPFVVIDKERGETPLEAVGRWRERASLPQDIPVSYAGRLDPMAQGKLLVLIGDECKRQKKYTGLDKEYVVEVLLGVSSDTGDVLGIPRKAASSSLPTRPEILRALRSELGTHERAYPVFSSKTVGGKPLFMYALEGTHGSVQIPAHPETFYRIDLLDLRTVDSDTLRARIEKMLEHTPISDEPSKALGADFRIGAIRPKWEELLVAEATYPVLTLRVTSGSGAYMRTLAERIGTTLGTSGLALSIRRTRIGRYQQFPFGIGYWQKQYR